MTNPTPTSGAADLPEALRIANVLDLAKQIDYYNHVQDDLEAAAAELRRLHALTTQQQRDLIAESHSTAEQKLRADQMTTQHAHQAALNTEARAQLAAALTAQAISKAPDHVAEVGNMVEQAISAEQAGVPAATVIKRGADREWMSERLGHLPDGVYSLYLAAPQPSPSPAPAQPVHVQNSPENEHVADDVSKSERESNMTAQPGQEGELLQLAKAYKEYIDALPADVVAALPAMPGVDGDWASEVLDRATRAAPQPATADAVKRRELVTNWFAEDWAIGKALGLLDDYDAAQREVKS